ncbi:MAG: SPFH domain-containing protein [Patescibacteria group bacterium]|nr:SPFH domain-containing protein [Patescibacteria group bacterium]
MAEREDEMEIIGKKLWGWFILAIITLSLISFGVLKIVLECSWLISGLFPFVFFVLFVVLAIIFGWSQIPHRHEWIVEIFGEYIGSPLKAGLYIIFPYFNFVNIKAEVFMGQQMIELFMNDSVKTGFGKGHVDFKDSSAPVDAMCYFTIHDSKKAVYEIEPSVLLGVADKMDGAIRSYLGGYNLNDANQLKVQFHLETILNGVIVTTEAPAAPIRISAEFIENSIVAPHLWQEIWNTWGVSIDSIVVSDIELSPKLMEAREKEIVAEAETKAAVHERKKIIILAEGEKQALQLTGEGITEQIKQLVHAGVSHEEAVAYLTNRKKWESMQKAGKTVLIEGSDGNMAGAGAAFAAGAGIVNSDNL